MAQLAARINLAAIGGGNAANNPLNRIRAEREAAEKAAQDAQNKPVISYGDYNNS